MTEISETWGEGQVIHFSVFLPIEKLKAQQERKKNLFSIHSNLIASRLWSNWNHWTYRSSSKPASKKVTYGIISLFYFAVPPTEKSFETGLRTKELIVCGLR